MIKPAQKRMRQAFRQRSEDVHCEVAGPAGVVTGRSMLDCTIFSFWPSTNASPIPAVDLEQSDRIVTDGIIFEMLLH